MSRRKGRKELPLKVKKEVFEAFQEYDKDNNGYVSIWEAQEVLMKKYGFPKDKVKALVLHWDKNKDQRLSYSEFADFYIRIQESISEMHSMFNEFDGNRDGVVSMDEAKQCMRDMAFSPEEVESLISMYDINQDGGLRYEEFMKFWSSA